MVSKLNAKHSQDNSQESSPKQKSLTPQAKDVDPSPEACQPIEQPQPQDQILEPEKATQETSKGEEHRSDSLSPLEFQEHANISPLLSTPSPSSYLTSSLSKNEERLYPSSIEVEVPEPVRKIPETIEKPLSKKLSLQRPQKVAEEAEPAFPDFEKDPFTTFTSRPRPSFNSNSSLSTANVPSLFSRQSRVRDDRSDEEIEVFSFDTLRKS